MDHAREPCTICPHNGEIPPHVRTFWSSRYRALVLEQERVCLFTPFKSEKPAILQNQQNPVLRKLHVTGREEGFTVQR